MSLEELGDFTDFTDESINRLSLSDQDDDGSLFSIGKRNFFDEIGEVKRIPSLDEPCSSTAVLLQNAEGDELQASEVFAGRGESSGSGRKSCHHELNELSNYAVFGVGDDEESRQEPRQSLEDIMCGSDEEEEADVISQTQELSLQTNQQENEKVFALLNEKVGESRGQNDQGGVGTLLGPSIVISDRQTSDDNTLTVTVILNAPNKVKKKRPKQKKSCSRSRDNQLCCISHVINPETNEKLCEEPIHVGNIQIPRDKWAAAFNEDDIGGCARHIFKAVFTPEEIETCTYSGKNKTQKLCRIRTEAIFDIVAWMRSNKKEYPYSFTNCPENFNILSAGKLTEEEKIFIIKKVFVEDRSQQRMKQDLQKQKEVVELELMGAGAPPKAKKSRKS